MAFRGSDSEGNCYESEKDMWSNELQAKAGDSDKPQWYQKGIDYWGDIPPTVDGVVRFACASETRGASLFWVVTPSFAGFVQLGGFGFVTNADVLGSEKFLAKVSRHMTTTTWEL
eukprot:88864-Prorocentrum_minimum.AAC.2